METTRFTSSLFAGLFSLVFVATMAISGCSTGELVGPDSAEEPAVESYRPDSGDAGHNDAHNNGGTNGGGTDDGQASHNETNEDRDIHN